MSTAGLIFSNLNRGNLPELTRRRILSSVPFGCRYRLVDFPLSNMVNAGITNVGILTDYNYKSLTDHIGNGKDWDLARRSGGVRIIPPNFSFDTPTLTRHAYLSRLDAMIAALDFIRNCNEDTIVLCDCDVIANMDLKELIREHNDREAELTFVAKRMPVDEDGPGRSCELVESDADGRLIALSSCSPETTGEQNVLLNVMITKTAVLRSVLENALAHGVSSFYGDVIRPNMHRFRIFVSYFDGWCAHINSLETYFKRSMQLLQTSVRTDLIGRIERPVLTKVRNSAPTKYMPGAKVTSSLIADGCVIEGTVENSILFRDVHVGRDTVIRNCILLQNTYTGNHVQLNCVITDKDVTIRDGRTLSGHETMPFYIDKGSKV